MTQVRAGLERVLDRAPREEIDPPPNLESVAEDLYDAVYPLAWLDSAVGWHLAHFVGALGSMFQAVADVARDTPEGPGWSAVVDLPRSPDAWLPWLAQFSGAVIPPGTSPADARAYIASTDGFKRGTPAALRGALAATLTGSKTVYFRERAVGSADPPYTLEVVTLTSETPSPATSLAALLKQKPGGIVLIFNQVTGWDYTAMTAKGGAYSTLPALYATYADLTYNRPHAG